MLPEVEQWKKETLQKLAERSKQYSAEDKKNLRIEFLERSITHVAPFIMYFADLDIIRKAVDACIGTIPPTKDVKLAQHNVYLKQIGELQRVLKAKYNLVPKNYFKRLWLPLGIGIGLPWGVVFKNIALGIPIGMAIGLIIGASFDRKAKKENRVI